MLNALLNGRNALILDPKIKRWQYFKDKIQAANNSLPSFEYFQVNSIHDKQYKKIYGRPDVQLHHSKNKFQMNFHELTNPFFIECKPDKENVVKDISKTLKYKYDKKSKMRQKLDKYGDFRVAITTPQLCDLKFDPLKLCDKGDKYGNYSFIRWLWKLGLGVMFFDPLIKRHAIYFNQQEVVWFE